MRSLRLLPLTLVPLVLYNVIAFVFAKPEWGAWFAAPWFAITLPLGAVWQVSVGDVLLFITLLVLFIELIKSTSTSTVVMIDHMLATLIFIVCLVEFLVVYRCGTSVFFAIMTAALIDIVAGFSISMRVARRSIGIGSA